MKKPLESDLILIAGEVSELTTEDSARNFVFGDGTTALAQGAAVGLAVAGLAGAASNAALSADSGTDAVQDFTAVIDGKVIAGCFAKVSFADGDYLECAVAPQTNGTFAAYAVRRPSDQTIWMFPHCSRGRISHWRFAVKMCVILSLLISCPMLALLFPLYDFNVVGNPATYLGATIFLTIGVVMGADFSLNTARRWMPFVITAEAIFKAYGYRDPRKVDLVAENRSY